MKLPEPLHQPLTADAQAVAAGRLQPECASSYTPSRTAARGVLLALHGFTAGPYQFSALAERLADGGIATYAARLPGHGARAAAGDPSFLELPKSRELAIYVDAAEDALKRATQLAADLKAPLTLLGFSLGGALALHLALQKPQQIARLVLLAPLVRPQGRRAQLSFFALQQAQRLGLGPLLDRLPFSWGELPTAPDWHRPGHWHFRVGHLFAVLTFAASLSRLRLPLRTPTQLITSGADRRCDPHGAQRLLQGATAPTYVYHFPAALQVPHAMLSAQENRSGQTRLEIETMVAAFVEQGVGSDNRSGRDA